MKSRIVIGVVLCLVGALWIGQGVGLIGGSFMSGEALWAIIGAIAVIFGIALLFLGEVREATDLDGGGFTSRLRTR